MKNYFLLKFVFPILLLFFFTGCNEETYMESVGHINVGSGDEDEVGMFIFTSINAITNCGKASIFIDDVEVGELTIDNDQTISCLVEPKEGQILKIIMRTGMHDIKVEFEGDCNDLVGSKYLERGICTWYDLP